MNAHTHMLTHIRYIHMLYEKRGQWEAVSITSRAYREDNREAEMEANDALVNKLG